MKVHQLERALSSGECCWAVVLAYPTQRVRFQNKPAPYTALEEAAMAAAQTPPGPVPPGTRRLW